MVVQDAEATLSATRSSAAQRECRPVIVVIIAVVAAIIATPNREKLWIEQKENPLKKY